MKKKPLVIFLLWVVYLSLSNVCSAQTTEFTYQGSLKSNGNPISGNYDFEFVLFDTLSNGTQLGSIITVSNLVVTNGVFSVSLNFGNQFSGGNRFLEIRVRQTGGNTFTTLNPRQVITSSPYSIRSLNATNADTATTAITASNSINFTGLLSGDISGTQSNTTVTKLRGITIDSILPTNGQVLIY